MAANSRRLVDSSRPAERGARGSGCIKAACHLSRVGARLDGVAILDANDVVQLRSRDLKYQNSLPQGFVTSRGRSSFIRRAYLQLARPGLRTVQMK